MYCHFSNSVEGLDAKIYEPLTSQTELEDKQGSNDSLLSTFLESRDRNKPESGAKGCRDLSVTEGHRVGWDDLLRDHLFYQHCSC